MAFPTTSIVLDVLTFSSLTNFTTPVRSGVGEKALSTNIGGAVVSDSSLSTDYTEYWNVQTYGPESEVWLKIAGRGNNTDKARLYLRLTSPGTGSANGYYFDVQNLSSSTIIRCSFFRLDAGTPSILGSSFDISATMANGEFWGLEMIGSTLTAYRNTGSGWSSVGTRSDATYSSAGRIGLGLSSGATSANAMSLQSFVGGYVRTYQNIAPGADSTLGSWVDQAGGTSNIYQSIDETVESDTDYVKSPNSPSIPAEYKFAIARSLAPVFKDSFTVTYRVGTSGLSSFDTLNFTCTLYRADGTTILGSRTDNGVGAGFSTDVTFTITDANAATVPDSEFTDSNPANRLKIGLKAVKP